MGIVYTCTVLAMNEKLITIVDGSCAFVGRNGTAHAALDNPINDQIDVVLAYFFSY